MHTPPVRDIHLAGRHVVIVGGGVAGIAAAVRLAQQGVAVTVVETRMRLGGRATSFTDPESGQTLDNCQHVLMRCCTNLIDLYERLGVMDKITWHKRLYFAAGRGEVDILEADDLPAPLHMTRSLLAFKSLTVREKIAIARGMLRVMQVSPAGRELLENESFADWLKQNNQPDSVIRKFWDVVIVSACNETLNNVSAKYALQVFQEGFLNNDQAYEMGLSGVPLVALYDAAETLLADAGGRLMLSTSAETFEYDGQRVTGLRLKNGERIAGDVFVSSVPFDRLAKLCGAEMLKVDTRLRPLDRIPVSPIIGIHLVVRTRSGQPTQGWPHLILTDSPIQWVFNKGMQSDGGEHLHCVISAAHDWVDKPTAELEALAFAEIQRVWPRGDELVLTHARAVKEKRATFSVRPGMDCLRPTTCPNPEEGGIDNLLLAGDWCMSGWPATMEGAARTGYMAAEAALDQLGVGASMVVDDLRASALYRMVSG